MLNEVVKLLEVIAWPGVAILLIWVTRTHIGSLLSGAKVKFSIGGQKIETTLPEFKYMIEEQASDHLTDAQVEYLVSLFRDGGNRFYENGVEEKENRKMLRPLRNAGLISTFPRNSILENAKLIHLSPLGRLFLRAKSIINTP